MERNRRSTSADVARRAGVSRATVSYVLNGRADQAIPESTRQRVLAAARDLSYTPNAAARALRAGESRLVLLVNEGIPLGPAMSRVVDALTAEVARAGRSLVLWQSTGPGGLGPALTHLDPCLTITLGSLDDAARALLADARIPAVDAGLGGDLDPADGEIPGWLQVDHLAGRGHRHIGVLSTGDRVLRRFAEPRVAGARRAARESGLPEPSVAQVPTGEALSVGAVETVLARWRDDADPVTAVACYNDYVAAATVAAATRMGLAVPGDLAVVGVDNEQFSRYTSPPLTTVSLDTPAFAREVWARAQHVLDGLPGEHPHDAPRFSLVLRGSS